MIQYPDGTEARVGDAVALDHGTYTGTVTHVIESPADLTAWDLDEPGLMIDTSYAGAVFYRTELLTRETIAFVSRAPA